MKDTMTSSLLFDNITEDHISHLVRWSWVPMIPNCVDSTDLLCRVNLLSHSAWSAKHMMICFFWVFFKLSPSYLCEHWWKRGRRTPQFLFLKKFSLCSARNLFHLIPTLRFLFGKVGTFLEKCSCDTWGFTEMRLETNFCLLSLAHPSLLAPLAPFELRRWLPFVELSWCERLSRRWLSHPLPLWALLSCSFSSPCWF